MLPAPGLHTRPSQFRLLFCQSTRGARQPALPVPHPNVCCPIGRVPTGELNPIACSPPPASTHVRPSSAYYSVNPLGGTWQPALPVPQPNVCRPSAGSLRVSLIQLHAPRPRPLHTSVPVTIDSARLGARPPVPVSWFNLLLPRLAPGSCGSPGGSLPPPPRTPAPDTRPGH